MQNWFQSSNISFIIEDILLSEEMIVYLMELISSKRPTSRKLKNSNLVLANMGYIERNLNTFIVCGDNSKKMSIEIKIKSGLKSCSPFVKQSRRIKLKYHRYALLQLYKLKQKNCRQKISSVQQGWGVFSSISKYEPSEICSMDFDRIRKCLDHLIDNPQNNLRVSVESCHVFGWDKSNELEDLKRSCDLFAGEGKEGEGLSTVMDAVAALLSHEPVLFHLELMQKLGDLLDSEGAAVVFGRLLQLIDKADQQGRVTGKAPDMSSVSDRASEMVQQHIVEEMEPGFMQALKELFSSNKISDDFLLENASIPHFIVSLFNLRIHCDMSEQEINSRSMTAFSVVESLTIADCLCLLKLWFLSLIAKDASLIIALQSIEDTTLIPTFKKQPLSVILQSDVEPGKVIMTNLDKVIAYSAKLIDIGMKPIEKIWKRYFEEELICF
jgi:hypothetical protein